MYNIYIYVLFTHMCVYIYTNKLLATNVCIHIYIYICIRPPKFPFLAFRVFACVGLGTPKLPLSRGKAMFRPPRSEKGASSKSAGPMWSVKRLLNMGNAPQHAVANPHDPPPSGFPKIPHCNGNVSKRYFDTSSGCTWTNITKPNLRIIYRNLEAILYAQIFGNHIFFKELRVKFEKTKSKQLFHNNVS